MTYHFLLVLDLFETTIEGFDVVFGIHTLFISCSMFVLSFLHFKLMRRILLHKMLLLTERFSQEKLGIGQTIYEFLDFDTGDVAEVSLLTVMVGLLFWARVPLQIDISD